MDSSTKILVRSTIIQHLPEEQRTFLEQPWFYAPRNEWMQLSVLRIICINRADYIKTSNKEENFALCLKTISEHFLSQENFISQLVNDIPGGEYLLTRGWFCLSLEHHIIIMLLKIHGYLGRVNPVIGDFAEHLLSFVKEINTNLSQTGDGYVDFEIEEDDDENDVGLLSLS
jgi:hypothetical protein